MAQLGIEGRRIHRGVGKQRLRTAQCAGAEHGIYRDRVDL